MPLLASVVVDVDLSGNFIVRYNEQCPITKLIYRLGTICEVLQYRRDC